MEYLAQFLGLKIMGTLEQRPGINAPFCKHHKDLVNMMKEEKVSLVLHEVNFCRNQAEKLSSKTGAKIADVAVIGGAFPDTKSYAGMVEHNIRAILAAAK
jgi:ABC-type Zn uptake system ZnuABC Zn-binding protein ZnuA